MFYVYEWYNLETSEVFYIGKGCKNRYKSLNHRNSYFLDYIKNNQTGTRILAYFENEEDALSFEHSKILEMKAKGQCSCNLDNGGTGGLNFIWTEEMKKNKSINNPMKNEKQKERMRLKNPMFNEETKKKVMKTKTHIVLFGSESSLIETTAPELAKQFNVTPATVYLWIKKGITPRGEICRYKNPPKRKKVIYPVLIDGEYFPSCAAASRYLGDNDSNKLLRALKNGDPIYKGHKCEYANQQPSDTKPDNSSIEGSTTNG